MVVFIKKKDSKKQIRAAVKRLSSKSKKLTLSDFYGKLTGKFGDGLTYQKELRNEWD